MLRFVDGGQRDLHRIGLVLRARRAQRQQQRKRASDRKRAPGHLEPRHIEFGERHVMPPCCRYKWRRKVCTKCAMPAGMAAVNGGQEWTLPAAGAIITAHEILAESSADFYGRLGLGARNLCRGFGVSEVRLRPHRRYPVGRNDRAARLPVRVHVVAGHPLYRRLFCRRRCGDLRAVLVFSRLAVRCRVELLRPPARPPIAPSANAAANEPTWAGEIIKKLTEAATQLKPRRRRRAKTAQAVRPPKMPGTPSRPHCC